MKNRKQDVLKAYDPWIEYDRQLCRIGYRGPRIISHFLKKFISSKSRILDVGCGTGLGGDALLNAVGRCTIVGTDLSQGMLDQAKKKNIYAQLIKANLRNPLPFRNKSFDAVVCIGVFEHFKTIKKELMELARVSKRYVAFYVLVVPFPDYHHHVPQRIFRALNDAGLSPIELFPFTAYYHAFALGVIAEKHQGNKSRSGPVSAQFYPATPVKKPITIAASHMGSAI